MIDFIFFYNQKTMIPVSKLDCLIKTPDSNLMILYLYEIEFFFFNTLLFHFEIIPCKNLLISTKTSYRNVLVK